MPRQLYKSRPVDIPCSVDYLSDSAHATTQHIADFPFICWPNGRPCAPVNMYLIDLAAETTGNSLSTYASQLSPLVRYCAANQIPVAQLKDQDIFDLSDQLQKECSIRDPNEKARGKNTVRTILQRAILFLFWYQKKFSLASAIPIIGESSSAPQIRVKRVESTIGKTKRAHVHYVHPAMPPTESPDPKSPIAQAVIEKIEQAVDIRSSVDEQKPEFVRRYSSHPELLKSHLHYMRARRHFMIWLMKRTGLRPSEMTEASVKEHINIMGEKRLVLPTKKRRKIVPPLRIFPIKLHDASVVHIYLNVRRSFIKSLLASGANPSPNDSFFLTIAGEPIQKKSLERDFARLVSFAGLRDMQACFSMFRHRFLTYEVIVHLKEFMVDSGKGPQLMTHSDYESILKRVSVKVGHASIESLWHYIDLAWEEIDVWGGAENALERMHAIDRLHDDLLAIKFELDNCQASKVKKQFAKDIAARLASILQSARQHIPPEDSL